ncbi:MAG: hypothetical protein ACK5Z5_04715 [Neisseriaceae bacterium]
MKRIEIFEKYWDRPTKADFEACNAHILIDRFIACYALKNDDLVHMIHPYQIDEITSKNNMGARIKVTMCRVINNLPENVWQQICKELRIK